MDDSGVFMDVPTPKQTSADIELLSDSSTLTNKSLEDDSRLTCTQWNNDTESGIDLLCREDMAFWSPTPTFNAKAKKGPKAKRKLGRLDKKKIYRTPLRRSERLRNKSREARGESPCSDTKVLNNTHHNTFLVSPSSPDGSDDLMPQDSPDLPDAFRTPEDNNNNRKPLINPIASPSPQGPMSPQSPLIQTPLCSRDHDSCRNQSLAALVNDYDHFGFMDYHDEIYLHRRNTELNYHPVESLANQSEVTPGMRAILAEWLTKIIHSLDLKFDTLFIATNIVDRFLVTTPITSSCVQLLGLTSVLVASKMNEVFPPTIPELLKTSCEKYHREHIRLLERLVLARLKFDLLAPTPIYFLEHYAADRIRCQAHSDEMTRAIMKARVVGRYLLELGLQDYNLCQFQPSLLALVALEQSDVILEQNTRKKALTSFGHAPALLMECMAEFQPIIDSLLTNGVDIDDILEKYASLFGIPEGYSK